ncbi:MAG: hypothetical protein R3Y24_04045 [Eubacteriales bacterium]
MIITINKQKIDEQAMGDISLYMNRLMKEVKEGDSIVFEPDIYEFKSKYACEEFCYITNNDYSLKKIAIPIINKKNIIIDGKGSTFMMTGRLMPFWIKESSNIVLKSLAIDYKRPLFSQGIVEEASSNRIQIRIDKSEFPYEIQDDVLYFVGEDYKESYIHGFLEYDITKKGPIKNAVDTSPHGIVKANELEEGVLEIFYPFAKIADIGSMMTIKHEKRFVPGIAMDHSNHMTLEEVHVKQAGTMAVVAQFCDTVTLKRITVATDEQSQRVVSANADATHFVGCRGIVTVEDCLFQSQLDDAFNVHGNYLIVDKVLSPKCIIVQIGHFQQEGIFGLQSLGKVQILDRKTMLAEGEVILKDKLILNRRYAMLTFQEEFYFIDGKEYCVDDIDSYPEVIFRNNVVQNNRARGILLTSKKKTVIENNVFKTEGAAIKISGDMDFWFESGGCSDIQIKNNHLESTCNKEWGHGLIDIDPEMEICTEGDFYHKNIVIEDNDMVINHWPLTYARSVENIIIKKNRIMYEDGRIIANDKKLPLENKWNANMYIADNIFETIENKLK